MSSVAIMQPYIFPYIGYFNLIHSSEKFVFLNDVNYINKGWINRNKLGSKNEEIPFTVPLVAASQNKKINDIYLFDFKNWSDKFLKKYDTLYKKELNYIKIRDLIIEIFNEKEKIDDLCQTSVKMICNYLGLEREFIKSDSINNDLKKGDRLIYITKQLGGSVYNNAIGGMSLYNKDYFLNHGLKLNFIQNNEMEYSRGQGCYIGKLCIIDFLVYLNKDEVIKHISSYNVI